MSENGFLHVSCFSKNPVRSPVYPPGFSKNRSPGVLGGVMPGLGYVVKIKHDEFFFCPLKDGATFPFPNGLYKRLIDRGYTLLRGSGYLVTGYM